MRDKDAGRRPSVYLDREGNGGAGMWVFVDSDGDECNLSDLGEALDLLAQEAEREANPDNKAASLADAMLGEVVTRIGFAEAWHKTSPSTRREMCLALTDIARTHLDAACFGHEAAQ